MSASISNCVKQVINRSPFINEMLVQQLISYSNLSRFIQPKVEQMYGATVKLPAIEGRTFFLVDPMLATGYSAAHGVDVLKKRGVKGENIIFMSLLCAPEGMETFQKLHPDVEVYTASLDDHLNEKAYIVPGLGDAGDRLYGTL